MQMSLAFEKRIKTMTFMGFAPKYCIPPMYLHLIFGILQFEISSLMNLIFSLFQTFKGYIRQKIHFKLGKNPMENICSEKRHSQSLIIVGRVFAVYKITVLQITVCQISMLLEVKLGKFCPLA
jgi:hypothetical protein